MTNSDTPSVGAAAQIKMDKYVTYIFMLSPFPLPLSLSCCITTDALMIREKVGISFARLIPEVSGREAAREREQRERSKECTRPGKMKEGETTNHQVGIRELASG